MNRLLDPNGFRTVKRSRVLLSLLLVLLVICNATGQVRRNIEISSYVQPSRAASTGVGRYFVRSFRFGGGVVPRGSAEFLSPAKMKLSPLQLKLVILDKDKLGNNEPDYDAIGIQWRGNVYQLAAEDDLIYPLMKFIQRGSYIAFTIPVAGFDKTYFQNNALVESLYGLGGYRSYVAQEFKFRTHAEFLRGVDLHTETDEDGIPASLKEQIIQNVNRGKGEYDVDEMGSYVNADFHVKYQVFFNSAHGKRVIDVGGLPLRYYWDIAADGSGVISDVEKFKFPETEFDLQDRTVMFFQTAAILRQFSQSNPQEFNRFLREVSSVVGKR